MSESPRELQITIPENLDGGRLDAALAAALAAEDLSRARIQSLIADGQVFKDGKAVTRTSGKAKTGETYLLRIPPAAPAAPVAEDIPLDILYEDDDIIVINKEAGMVVHPAAGHAKGTLVNALLAHCGDSLSGIGGVKRPGIVHRLDKDTSGLMVVAKNDAAHKNLTAQLAAHTVRRIYRAIVWGVPTPASGMIEGNIGRSSSNRKKMAVLENGGKEAITEYQVDTIFEGGVASLVTCRLHTGRTHQIRVHMTHIGHWLIGDPLYRPNSFKRLRKGPVDIFDMLHEFPRQALHAAMLSLQHPRTDEEMSWQTALPKDMHNILLAGAKQSCSMEA